MGLTLFLMTQWWWNPFPLGRSTKGSCRSLLNSSSHSSMSCALDSSKQPWYNKETVEICEVMGWNHRRDALNEVYRELYDLLGYDTMIQLFNHFKGYQVSFPVRLYDRTYAQKMICHEYSGSNAKELARKFGYSERWVRALAASKPSEKPI